MYSGVPQVVFLPTAWELSWAAMPKSVSLTSPNSDTMTFLAVVVNKERTTTFGNKGLAGGVQKRVIRLISRWTIPFECK